MKAELLEMRRQFALLDEVERAVIAQETAVWTAQQSGRSALNESDLLGWKQSRMEAATAAWNGDQLNAIRDERRNLYELANTRYRTSRILSEQMDKLLEETTQRSDEQEGRLAQALLDERYLSRRRWMELYGRETLE